MMYEIEYLDIEQNKEYELIVKKVLEKCFQEEQLDKTKLVVEITLTTPEHIREINKEYRNIDKSTDVLSFPMFEKEDLEKGIKNNKFQEEDVLGDIVISIQRVKEQAEEYGHSFERELSYMIVHGFYHLMGYDHIKEEDKIQMRKKEKTVLKILNILRS